MSKPRLIEPGSCLWCGHKPHAETCPCTITTSPSGRIKTQVPCPCSQHLLEVLAS
jgi:hypothetical protein